MQDLLADLAKIIESSSPGDGMHGTPVPGVYCLKFSRTEPRSKRHWRACLGIIAQGCKEVVLGPEIYRFDEGCYTAAPVDLPVVHRIAVASPRKPFLALLIDLDPLILTEIASRLDTPKEPENASRAVFIGKAGEQMLMAGTRLGNLFQKPSDAPVLGPLVVKEIIYHLLKGENGPAIRQFARAGSKTHKISQAIHRIRSELNDDVDVAALAKAASMSRSAFFKHFREVTTMSPIQYQKRLRLLEARRLMIDVGETAEGSAFKAGYRSASQFSREYSRMFGGPPLRDAMKLKNAGYVADSV
ncbi:MAG TPA: AraC family transcriptional regulator [Candidatus Acidoferrales bacterium]|nr:AraC family transcriptional regulator [Candidatus Acidoferrales bacterium]